jgi:RND superfamily putative drug exporter
MERFARALVRWRWAVLGVWLVVGVVAAIRAPDTPRRLDIRGGSERETEASRTEALLNTRFTRPIGEFFAVVLDGPARFDVGAGRQVLDSVNAALERQPYVRGLVSYPSTGDTTFLSRDRRSTFVIVALDIESGDSAGVLVVPARQTVRQALARAPGGSVYRTWVTGRAPLDLDVRTVVTSDSKRGEQALLPLTLVILILAFGAMVAAVLPLIVGVLAISVSLAIIGLIAHVTPMSVFVLNMTTMIGLGVGIDYSLLVVTRFREELGRGVRSLPAAVATMLTAGRRSSPPGLPSWSALARCCSLHSSRPAAWGSAASSWSPSPWCSPSPCCQRCSRCWGATSTGPSGWPGDSPGITRRRCGRSGRGL